MGSFSRASGRQQTMGWISIARVLCYLSLLCNEIDGILYKMKLVRSPKSIRYGLCPCRNILFT
jgi:hypothetical protein